ncbi:MAG TPA: outer membrane beta-barrel protein [Thermoanaerobaculia bacterium]|nr:outer membrane beta-barrel protein [Thermoanaerobaculia bacterium]
MSKRARISLLLLAAVASSAPVLAQGPAGLDQAIRLRLGGFRPEGDSQYWTDKARDFTGSAADLEDTIGGVDYRYEFTPHWALLVSGSSYVGHDDPEYRSFTDSRGQPVRHRATLAIDSTTAGIVVYLTGPDAAFRPYVGAGGGMYSWRLEEDGRFIDFNPPPPTVFRADSRAEGTAFGNFWLAGFEVPIGWHWGFFAEGRWHQVEDDLNRDFADFGKIDLSGRDVSAGVTYRF